MEYSLLSYIKTEASNFVSMLTLAVFGSYEQVHYTAVPSTSVKITISTFCKGLG